MIVLGVIFDLFIWKFQKLAKWLIYFELFYTTLNGCMPFDQGDLTYIVAMSLCMLLHIAYSCEQRSSTIAVTIVFTFINMILHPYIYNYKMSALAIALRIPISFTVFLFCTMFSMAVTFIVKIQGKMSNLIVENLKLLDRMHEGLIVINKNDLSLKFASRPAIRVLKQLPLKDQL